MVSFVVRTARARRAYGAMGHFLLTVPIGFATAVFCLAGAAAAKPVRIIAFGDSLTVGYLLPEGQGFVPKLQAALRAQGHDVTVVNAGVSGDTSHAGLARLDWTMGSDADAVILELGANDMLRGIEPSVTKDNLSKIIGRLKARGVKVLLCGMLAPPSMGEPFEKAFDAIYPALAKQYDVTFYPFFLDGIMGDRSKHLPDQIHPNDKGVDTIVSHILPSVDKLLLSAVAKI